MPKIYLPAKKKSERKHFAKTGNVHNQTVYNTVRWRTMRLEKLKADPLCEECLKNEVITSGVEVHHIKPISTASSIFEKQKLGFDYNNLQTLCKQCHREKHHKPIGFF